MRFFRSIRGFFRTLFKGSRPEHGVATPSPKSGGLDIEVERNRPC